MKFVLVAVAMVAGVLAGGTTWGDSSVPEGYRPLAYLNLDGAQWVNTGYSPKCTDRLEMTLALPSDRLRDTGGYYALWCTRNGNGAISLSAFLGASTAQAAAANAGNPPAGALRFDRNTVGTTTDVWVAPGETPRVVVADKAGTLLRDYVPVCKLDETDPLKRYGLYECVVGAYCTNNGTRPCRPSLETVVLTEDTDLTGVEAMALFDKRYDLNGHRLTLGAFVPPLAVTNSSPDRAELHLACATDRTITEMTVGGSSRISRSRRRWCVSRARCRVMAGITAWALRS